MKSRSFVVDNFETEVVVGDRILNGIAHSMNPQPKIIFVPEVLPDHMKKYLEKSFPFTDLIYVEDGEALKSTDGLYSLLSFMISHRVERGDTVGYAGGGTIGDTVGFAASVFKRGVEFIAIPTTFLSQVDSALGGKNSINFQGYKNMVGTFYLPKRTISDIFFLKDMSDSMFRNGLGELIKYFILEPERFSSLLSSDRTVERIREDLERIVFSCSEIKMKYVSADFRDRLGIRRMLNLGHTVAHALESSSGFSMSHGESVYWGMLIEAKLVQSMGIDSRDTISKLKRFLPFFESSRTILYSNIKSLAEFIDNDKKVAGGMIEVPFPMPGGKGNMVRMDAEWLNSMLNESFLDDLLA